MSRSVRLYGPFGAQGSFGSIAQGYADGFVQAGVSTAQFHTTDMMDEDEPPGACAELALGLGLPNMAHHMVRRGRHRWRGWMVAPNSTFVPEKIFRWVEQGHAEILTPSEWGAEVIRRIRPDVKIHVLPHGVPATWRRLRPRAPRAPGGLRALHVTSTAGERKGTWATAQAFDRLAAAGALGEGAQLVIKADWLTASTLADLASEHVRVIESASTPDWVEFVRSFDLVVQPSRAEGFGLVPLEALALGVPVVATTCTGHGMFLRDETRSWAALEAVPHGPEEPLFDDGEGALAPTVDEAEIGAAVARACRRLDELAQLAEETRLRWVNTFGYDVVCGDFMRQIEQSMKGEER